MNILVTGGAGFIGSHTAVELINAVHTPIILDNLCNSDSSLLDGIEKITGIRPRFYKGDCTDAQFVATIFEAEHIDGIIHFAALKAVGESINQPLRYYRNNIDSLLTVLEIARAHSVQYFVFSSSATVYGEPDMLPIPETAARKQATSAYGNTKQICEDIVRDEALASDGHLRAIALRYFNPIGAHPSGFIGEFPIGTPNNLVPFVTQTAAGIREKLTIFGDDYPTQDGTCIRDYIHVVDLAQAHIKTLEYLQSHQDLAYDIYNVGTGKGVSVKELLDTFEKVCGVKVPHGIGLRRAGDIVSCYADPSKININLDWHAKLSLEDALRDAWRWQEQLNR
jgi:UDP-glucose 4-epimerase